MFEPYYMQRPVWWRQIVDQFQALQRDLCSRAPFNADIKCHEDFDQVNLTILNSEERTQLLSLIARCEEEAGMTTLYLTVNTSEGIEELLRLVWDAQHSMRKLSTSGRSGRGLNALADQRQGVLASGDAVALLRERLVEFVNDLESGTRKNALMVAQPHVRALKTSERANSPEEANIVILPRELRDRAILVARSKSETFALLVPLAAADRAEFENPHGLYRDFTLACRGAITHEDVAAYAQRILELMIVRYRAELKAQDRVAAAALGMKGALKLLGVGVAFGVEMAAAAFAFGAWLHADWEGWVYALTGVGLIGGGLVPITTGRAREWVIKVAIGWSIAVACARRCKTTSLKRRQNAVRWRSKNALPLILSVGFTDRRGGDVLGVKLRSYTQSGVR